MGILGTAALRLHAQNPSDLAPGAPPAFGTGTPIGPEVSATTFAEADKLVQFEMTDADRAVAAASWRKTMAGLYERRVGPRKVVLEDGLAPATKWNPVLAGMSSGPDRDRFVRGETDPGPLPSKDDDIAFAPLTKLSRWIESRKLTSERLTNIYLKRIEQFDPKLHCVITVTRDLALRQAKQADEEIAAGKYRGPLHGIPWGGKDLLDTAGIPTTYGAEPFRNRVPHRDATVVQRLHEAGAVLIARRGIVGIECRSRRGNCCGTCRIRHRQRNRRKHYQPVAALRDYRPPSNLRTRGAYGRDDAMLVARQAWPNDPQCGRRDAGAPCHHRPRRGGRGQRAQPSGFRCERKRYGPARWIFSQVDE